jgi:hypothetical protein
MPVASAEARRLLIASPVGLGRGGIGVPGTMPQRPVTTAAAPPAISHPVTGHHVPQAPDGELVTYHGPPAPAKQGESLGASADRTAAGGQAPTAVAVVSDGMPDGGVRKIDPRWITPGWSCPPRLHLRSKPKKRHSYYQYRWRQPLPRHRLML